MAVKIYHTENFLSTTVIFIATIAAKDLIYYQSYIVATVGSVFKQTLFSLCPKKEAVYSTKHPTKWRHNTDDHNTYVRGPCSSLNTTDKVTHKTRTK